MNQVKNLSKISQLNNEKGILCFYMYFAVMTLTKAMGLDSNNGVYNIMFALGCVLLLYRLIMAEYSVKEIFALAAILGIAVICMVISREKTLVLFAISVAGMKDCDYRRTLKIIFSVRVVITTLFVLLALGEIINPGFEEQMTTSFTWKNVYDFGYSTPNNAFINVFIIIMLYLYLNYERLNYKHFIVTSVISVLMFEFTNSRTGFLLSIGIWFFIFIDKFITRRKLRRIFIWLLSLSSLFSGLLSWIATVAYQPSGSYIWEFVNRIFSGRLNITQMYYRELHISLFPRSEALMTSLRGFGFLDNMYMNVFFNDGFVVYVLILGVLTWSNIMLLRRNRYKELIFVTIFSIYAILEEFPLNPTVNPFILLIGVVIYQELILGQEVLKWSGKNSVQSNGKE